jgi:hypothetical protein
MFARQTLCLWVGNRCAQWGLLTGRGKHAAWRKLGEAQIRKEGEAASLSVLCAILQDLPGTLPEDVHRPELRVIIAETWLPIGSLPWIPALRDQDSARVFAREYLINLGFAVAANDEVCLDDMPYGKARLAIAYPQALLQAIQVCATRWRAHWRSLCPAALLAWRGLSREYPARALMLLDKENVTLCLGVPRQPMRRARLQEIRTLAQTHRHSPADAVSLVWKRLCLRQPQAVEIKDVLIVEVSSRKSFPIAWLSPFVLPDKPWRRLEPNAKWLCVDTGSYALDACARPPRRRAIHWLALFVALIVAGGLAFETWTQFKRANASRIAYETSRQVTRVAPPPVWSRDELARIAVVNTAIRQVNLPIGAVLQALRPPRDIRVAVLQVETAVAPDIHIANTLKITAEAASSAEMTHYVAFVSERKPFIRAYLTHHEISGDDAARFRFTMEAQWND